MDVLLINSPIYDKKVADTENYLPPFGLGYIASELERNGIEVKLLDAVYNNLTVEDIENIIEQHKPKFIGLNLFSVNLSLVKKIIENCNIETTFLLGGKATKYLIKDIVSFNAKNKIICTIGEGDFITTAIIKGELQEEASFNNNNVIVYEVDKSSIYFPKDISALKLNRKYFVNRSILNPYNLLEESIITSRECMYNCAFCGAARDYNKNVYIRERNIESIIAELKDIREYSPNTKSIRILDDLFLKNRSSILKAIEIFKANDFEWRAMSHIKSLQGNTDLLRDLKLSGCRELEIGVESGNQEIRDYINKEGHINDVYQTICSVLDSGINVKAYFIFGFPNETKKQCNDTYEIAKKMYNYSLTTAGNFRASAFQFRPYHGTRLYDEINKELNYVHNDAIKIDGRNQFNFMAENFSQCSDDDLNYFVTITNNLGREREK